LTRAVDVTELIDHLASDGTLLATAAEHAGWGSPVPNLDWTVRDLVTHVGGVHRWATDLVATAGHDLDTAAGRAVGTGPDDGELLDWFLAGHAALVTALSEAPADLDAAAFLPTGSPLEFWARRQAHETAMHRADAQGADGADTLFDADFAQDGIGELVRGFARRKSNAITRTATVLLAATDGQPWTLTFGGERIEATATPTESATAAIRGTSSDLYLWLWNRPSAATVEGDTSVTDLWHDTVRVRWSG
jgi:uncharacterized protein (TIGR03083 family)